MENLIVIFSTISLFIYFFSTVFYIVYNALRKNILGNVATILLGIGLIIQTVALILRTYEVGHFPFITIYETLILWSWLIGIIFLILQFKFKIKPFGALIAPLVFLVIAVASILPPSYQRPSLLVPALQSYWLEFHISTCFISYACFAISFLVGVVYMLKRSNSPEDILQKDKLDIIGYKAISIGFPFLTIGIVSGSIWANTAWGSYWSWDPKETWALITWFIYAIYLHLRIFAKWKGRSSAIASIIGFIAVLFTFIGVNFLLSGLHSYL